VAQPVGLGAAFVALGGGREHLRNRSLNRHVARIDHALPLSLGLIEKWTLAGDAVELDDPAKRGQESVAVL
jgi:hypothetical protein